MEKERLLTEAETAALNNKNPSPLATTTAPVGAPINEVEAGMHREGEEHAAPAPYAEGGSLAKELAREEAEKAKEEAKKEEVKREEEKREEEREEKK